MLANLWLLVGSYQVLIIILKLNTYWLLHRFDTDPCVGWFTRWAAAKELSRDFWRGRFPRPGGRLEQFLKKLVLMQLRENEVLFRDKLSKWMINFPLDIDELISLEINGKTIICLPLPCPWCLDISTSYGNFRHFIIILVYMQKKS